MTNRAEQFVENKNKKTKNPYRITSDISSSTRTSRIPLKFKNLKANTKYKIFLQNNEGVSQEDITNFCLPFGESVEQNNNQYSFNTFTTTDAGTLSVLARPFGVDSVSLAQDNWANHWRFARQGLKFGDVGRQNFVIVEAAKVDDSEGPAKLKNISGRTNPAAINNEAVGAEIERYVQQKQTPDVIQTFFVDPNSLGDASSVDITEIVLYFRNKPNRTNNKSGLNSPGATISLVDMIDGAPVTERQYANSIRSIDWDFITSSTDASVATVFEFNAPVRLYPGRFYGICVKFDDEDYALWSCVKGDILVGSDEASSGPSKDHRGSLFNRTNAQEQLNNSNFDTVFTEINGTDLKFDIRAAQYDLSAANDYEIDLVNMNQEFFIIANTNDNWIGAEYVYDASKPTSNGTVNVSAGNTVIVGSNTSFTDFERSDKLVLEDTLTDIVQVIQIDAIESDEKIIAKDRPLFNMTAANVKQSPVAMIDHYDFNQKLLYLRNSSARDGLFFEEGDTIVGVESGETAEIQQVGALPVSVFVSDVDINIPSTFEIKGEYQFSEKDGDDYKLNPNRKQVDFFRPNYVRDYEGLIVSRSLEAQNKQFMFDENFGPDETNPGPVVGSKSTKFTLSFSYDGVESKSFEAPAIDVSRFNLVTRKFTINNDATNEHTNDGAAFSKHISKRLVLGEGKVAEDIRIIQNAYKPIGADIKVYAKILNNEDGEAFNDKNWTELELISGVNEFSASDNPLDFREYEYAFPSVIPSDTTLDGTVTTTSGNAVITGVGTTFQSDLEVGQVIKLYSPLFENNYGFFSITNIASDTELTLHETISNTNILGTGFKIDTVKTPQTGYLNPLNLNIVRYFGPNGEVFDGYSSVAIKTVLLSEDELIIPTVDDYRVISVSA